MHASAPGVKQSRLHLNQVSNQHWPVESDATGIHGNTVLSAPTDGTHICRLVDPAHDRAAMNLASPVDVCRGCEES